MPHFRFVAIDSTGQSKRGTIEASTEAEASARIAKRGLKVTQITPVEAVPAAPVADSPRHGDQNAATPSLDLDSKGDQASPVATAGRPPRLSPAWVSLALSGLAVLVAIAALVVALVRDPLGSGLANYDFSTPKAALISQMKIALNKDIRALLELQSQIKSKKLKEAIDTVEVRKEAEFQGKKILFVAFKEDGVNKYKTGAFEKHAETGFWQPTYVSAFTVEKENKELAAQMRRWEEAGELLSK
jgi:hypothetical protein